jgi:hypothetical protein
MTDHSFSTRSDFGTTFSGMGAQELVRVKAKLIQWKKVCKLANAAQSKFIQSGKGQISRHTTLSAKCQQRISLDGEILKLFSPEVPVNQTFYSGALSAMEILIKVRNKVHGELKHSLKISYGTADIYDVDDESDASNYGTICTEEVQLSGKYFYEN